MTAEHDIDYIRFRLDVMDGFVKGAVGDKSGAYELFHRYMQDTKELITYGKIEVEGIMYGKIEVEE